MFPANDPEGVLTELKVILSEEMSLDVEPEAIQEATEDTTLESLGVGEFEAEEFMDAINLRLLNPLPDSRFETWTTLEDVVNSIV